MTGHKHYGKLAKVGVVWGFAMQMGNSLLLLPTAMVLARLLTPEEAGVAAAATFFTQLCGRLTQFGFGVSLVRVAELRRDHAAASFVGSLALGATGCVLLTLLAPLAGAYLRSPEAAAAIPIAGLTFLIMPFSTVAVALLSRDMRFKSSSMSEWAAQIVESTTGIGFALAGLSFWSIIYARLAADITRAVITVWMSGWLPSVRFTRAAMRDIFSFGIGIYAKNLMDFSAQNLDNLIVGRTLGIGALGFYDKAFNLVHRFTARVLFAGPGVSFRIFALIHEDPERFKRAYRKVVLSVTLVGFPLYTGMVVMATDLVDVLFGATWLAVADPLRILCIAGGLNLLTSYASTATQAKGHIWAEVKRQALFTVVLVCCVTVFSRWGITGAACGVLLATAIKTAMMQGLVRGLAGLRWSDMLVPQIPAVTCSAGLALVLLATVTALHELNPGGAAVGRMAIATLVGATYYAAFLLFCGFSEVRALVRETAVDLAPALAQRLRLVSAS